MKRKNKMRNTLTDPTLLPCGFYIGTVLRMKAVTSFKRLRIDDHGDLWRVIDPEECKVIETRQNAANSVPLVSVPLVSVKTGHHVVATADEGLELAGPEAMLELGKTRETGGRP